VERRNDVTEITHANECGCTGCRLNKGAAFRVVVEKEPEFNPLDKPWYNEPVTEFEYKEYRLNYRFIGDDGIEYRYELHHTGKM
jgi:hypothetical protein